MLTIGCKIQKNAHIITKDQKAIPIINSLQNELDIFDVMNLENILSNSEWKTNLSMQQILVQS